MNINEQLALEFKLQQWQIDNTVNLIDEGNTIPFIARYRKEAHGTLDDQLLREINDRLDYLRGLEKRKEEVISSIETLGVMTDEIALALSKAVTLAEVEDIYRPYKPKRKTRASVARSKGLEPLSQMIFEQKTDCPLPIEMAEAFVSEENEVLTREDALQGAMDIIAEDLSDDANIRRRLKNLFSVVGTINVKAADPEEKSVYEMYYDFTDTVKNIASYRVLAIDRGEREGFLKVKVELDAVKAMNVLTSVAIKNNESPCLETIQAVCTDAYNRLIYPSVEREIRSNLTEEAAKQGIKNFASNLKPLLMQPPIKGKRAIGLDPGYRTGCKVAVVDETGKVLDTGVIYVTHSEAQKQQAAEFIRHLIDKYKIDIISIGNGTASKETEIFTAETIKTVSRPVSYMVVNEAGASVYSASKLAAEEFPQFDVSLRSAVSIARRLQDPLAELVKIEPKAIGVGQYQHDMPKKELESALDSVVEDCVNSVGVDLNTASPSLLQRVAGINSAVAKNIAKYREENGAFEKRSDIKKVPKLGAKAFEQCAGFMRIPESKNILDNTSVHPESYPAAKALLEKCGYTLSDVKNADISDLDKKVNEIGIEALSEEIGVGVPTLTDIVSELMKPGRDIRDELPKPMLRTDVMDMNDLTVGMMLKGTVRNVIDFGAFVDIGVHQDGLIHISEMSNKRIKHPSEVLTVGDVIDVWVKNVDVQRKRIGLTMKGPQVGEG